MSAMKIWYLDNSGFALEIENSLLVFDYFNDMSAGGRSGFAGGVVDRDALAKYERVYVFVSHRHYDHFDRMIFKLAEHNPHTKYILDVGIFRIPSEVDAVRMGVDAEYADDFLQVHRCPSTDIGGSFAIRCGGERIFHAGDLNCWHWATEWSQAEEREARENFTRALAEIREHADTFDVAFFPLDPRLKGPFDDGALEFLQAFSPRLFVPMHFQNKFQVVQGFAGKVPAGTQIFAISQRGDSMEFV